MKAVSHTSLLSRNPTASQSHRAAQQKGENMTMALGEVASPQRRLGKREYVTWAVCGLECRLVGLASREVVPDSNCHGDQSRSYGSWVGHLRSCGIYGGM